MSPRPGATRSGRALLWLSVAALLALTLALHREVLFSGSIYHMDDAADGYYPARVAFRRALQEGAVPTWEPGAFAGWPLLADPYYGWFYPLNFVFYLGRRAGEPDTGPAAGIPAGLGLSVALHTLLGGIGMLLLLRRRLLPPGDPHEQEAPQHHDAARAAAWAALLGAIGFTLSSFLVVRARHIIFVQLCALCPWLLYGIESFLAERRRRYLVLCALTTALIFLCGAHSLLHFAVLVLLPYIVARLARDLVEGQGAVPGAFLRRSLLPLLAAAGAGVLTAAIALWPTLATMPLTSRALQTDRSFAASYAWPDWRYLQTLLVPDIYGVGEQRGAPWFSRWNHWEMAGYYQGAVLTLLAPLGGLLALSRRSVGRPERLALLGVGLLAVLTALGDAGPTHPLLFRFFPLYGALRCPARALFMLTLVVPILGAHGALWLLARPATPRRGPAVALALLLLGVLGGAAVLLWQRAARLPLSTQVAQQAAAHLVLVLALALPVVALRRLGAVPASAALCLLALLSAAEQLRIDRGYVQPKPADFAPGTERFGAVEWLARAERGEGRVAHDPGGPFRLYNIGSTVGFESADGYDSVQLWRYTSFLYILNHGRPYPHQKQKDDFAAAGIQRFDSPLVDLLGVRWLIAPAAPSARWRPRFAPDPQKPPAARYEPAWDPRLQVFENPAALPRAFVVYGARHLPTLALEMQALAEPGFDPRRQVLLGAPTGPAAPSPPLPALATRALTPARVLTRERHRLVVAAEAEADGVLVLSEVFHPGWSATVDGAPQPLLPADLALRGLPLRKGSHRIELRFHFAPLQRGAQASLLGLAAMALLLLIRTRSRPDTSR